MRAGVTMGLTGRSRSVLDDALPLVLLLLVVFCTATLCTATAQGASGDRFARVLTDFAVAHPPWYARGTEPESPDAYRARVAMIARVVTEETRSGPWPDWWSPKDRAAAVFVKLWSESRRLSIEVHEGRKLGDRGRAICLGQLHRNGLSVEEWRALAGSDEASTRRCVREVQRVLVSHLWRCGRGRNTQTALARAFVGYGTGATCELEGRDWALARARMWAWLREARP